MFNNQALEPSSICKATCSKNMWIDVDLEVMWRSYVSSVDRMQEGNCISAHLLSRGVKGSTVDSQSVVLSNRIFTLWRFIFSAPQSTIFLGRCSDFKVVITYRMNLSKTSLRRFWLTPVPLPVSSCNLPHIELGCHFSFLFFCMDLLLSSLLNWNVR